MLVGLGWVGGGGAVGMVGKRLGDMVVSGHWDLEEWNNSISFFFVMTWIVFSTWFF